jgi:hypothetical protein
MLLQAGLLVVRRLAARQEDLLEQALQPQEPA